MKKKISSTIAALLSLLLLLSACSQNDAPLIGGDTVQSGEVSAAPLTVTACVSGVQDTLDPARATAKGSETILFHLFENLMCWVDDGSGYAVLAPGQAESYTLETDYAGNATYTFTLRENILWSDGKPVTAADFVTAWQRLADPANEMPHSALLDMVSGYAEVQSSGDVSLLGVSAPDERTFVAVLEGSCAYFLEEVCAGAYTMPVRADLAANSLWGTDGSRTVTNGAYTLSLRSEELVTLTRSETYYAACEDGPQEIRFIPIGPDKEINYGTFLNGGYDLICDLPLSALQQLSADGSWSADPTTATYTAVINTLQPPFDDPAVRRAFLLAVDETAILTALGDCTSHASTGIVPWGVSDYSEWTHPQAEAEPAVEEPVLPDPTAEQAEEDAIVYRDFHLHSHELVTLPVSEDNEADCLVAQGLMAQAGYAEGGNFPVVEYVYLESESNRSVARALQNMWQTRLGVTVTVRGVSEEEFSAVLTAPVPTEETAEETDPVIPAAAPFQMAGMFFHSDRSDAESYLSPWYSTDSRNISGYTSGAFDILLDSARASVSVDARDAYLHDAEAILLTEAPVIPLYYTGSSYQLAEDLTGLYRAPDGVYFLSGLRSIPVE